MPNLRIPLPLLIDRNRDDQNGYGWADFQRIARLKKRPSTHSIAVMFNKNDHTVAKWLRRYDEEEK